MEKINLFERASREKWRFTNSTKGNLNAEDLWNLSLVDLDNIAKSLKKLMKEADEDTLFQTAQPTTKLIILKYNLVAYIFGVLQKEEEDRANSKIRAAKRREILEQLDKQEKKELEGKSKEELLKMLDEL